MKLNKQTFAARSKAPKYDDINVKISNPIQSAANSNADGTASYKLRLKSINLLLNNHISYEMKLILC